MNFHIIIGILLIALGTGVTVYGYSIIVGILLNALGMGIMVYGQLVKSKVDSAEVSRVLQDKVDNVLKRIDEVREGETDEASVGKIQQIEEEFKNWASEFLKNRELRKVELARTELDSVDVQLKVSNEWRPIFEYVLTTIESMAKAYNAKSGETIKVDFPSIPPNLYSEEASNYGGRVIFQNKVVWLVRFLSSKPPKKENPPQMIISFQKDEAKGYLGSYFSIKSIDDNSFITYLTGPNVPTAAGIEGKYPIDSYRDSLKPIMRRLFEAQLLRD
jgi:hypothetical protein